MNNNIIILFFVLLFFILMASKVDGSSLMIGHDHYYEDGDLMKGRQYRPRNYGDYHPDNHHKRYNYNFDIVIDGRRKKEMIEQE